MSVIQLHTGEFKIQVGPERGKEALIGKVQKGMAVLDGPATRAPEIGGKIMFPNYGQGWGRRVINGKEPDNKRVEITDREYVGQIEWLTIDDPKGYIIFYRYIKGQSSLDYQYQVNRLGLADIKNDNENGYITLQQGENEIDPALDPAWATFVQIHYMNEDSLCRRGVADYMYRNVKQLDVTKTEAKSIDESFDAMKIIKEASTSMDALHLVKGIIESYAKEAIKWNVSKETTLYDSLLLYANQNARTVLEAMKQYKQKVSEMLSFAESYEVIDYKADNVIVVLKPKKEILLNDIPVKGKNINDWIMNNCMNPNVAEVVDKLKEISKILNK